MTTMTAFFDTAAQPETAKQSQETCDICGRCCPCHEVMGDFLCEDCSGAPVVADPTLKELLVGFGWVCVGLAVLVAMGSTAQWLMQ